MTALWILLAALLVVLLAGLGCFELACARRPQPDMADPAVLKQSKYAPLADEILSGIAFWRAQEPEDIFLPSFDGLRLHGQLVQQPESKGTILLFHGYRSSWAIDFSIVLPYYHSLGYDLLVVDERAHGQSEGDYITFGVHERRDIVTWAQYAAMHFGPAHPLILDGLSMGAATVLMASELALPASVRGIIADCGFSSPYAIMKSVLHWRCPWLVSGPLLALTGVFTRLFGGFGLREVSATEAVAHTKLPILFIHGTGDQFVPCSMSQAAYDACTGEKRLILVEGAGHGQSYLVDRPRVQAAVREFLTDYVLQEAST